MQKTFTRKADSPPPPVISARPEGFHGDPVSFDHGKPYRPLSQHYRERFGVKVYKVSVSVAQTCPNREGRNGMQVCLFCDEWGSAAYHLQREKPLEEQIRINREAIRQRYRARQFLVYFQAYTNTHGRAQHLRQWFEMALGQQDIVGLVLGTRPDCLPRRVIELLREFAKKTYLSVELGVQSLRDDQLQFLSRGHDAAASVGAIRKLKQIKGINVCAHLIFGLPHETETQLKETAETLSELQVDGVKLHNLHVLRSTPLEESYRKGEFKPLSLETYARRVAVFLDHLSPHVAVHRLAAVASRWDELVAPEWNREKMRPVQFIEDLMLCHGHRQGRFSLSNRSQKRQTDSFPVALHLPNGACF